MEDNEIVARIQELAAEEHALYARAAHDQAMNEEEREALHEIQRGLDQCWDLLRQRRARRQAGQDPDTASEREQDTVENYLS